MVNHYKLHITSASQFSITFGLNLKHLIYMEINQRLQYTILDTIQCDFFFQAIRLLIKVC